MKPLASILLAASFVGSAFGQLDLSSLYTQTVKAGQPWAAIETQIESISLDMKINRGVVTTVATLEYTPGPGRNYEYVCQPQVCSADRLKCEPQVCEYRITRETDLDSLETTLYFQQPDNTILTDMHLWVGETKVRAALQERALASAQYEDIVKRRRDPALIETWGNGSYQMRIFPNESRKSRKIEIEFVQGTGNRGLHLPDLAAGDANPFQGVRVRFHRSTQVPNRSVANVRLTAVALDGKTYSLKWEGLGSGQVGSTRCN